MFYQERAAQFNTWVKYGETIPDKRSLNQQITLNEPDWIGQNLNKFWLLISTQTELDRIWQQAQWSMLSS